MTPPIPEYPLPPYDAVMPADAQHIVLIIAIVALAGFALIALVQSLRQKTALPLLFLVAGFCTVLLEPIVTHLGHAVHPEIGQIMLFKTADRAIPWHIALIYSFYFGGVYMFMLGRIRDQKFDAAYVWKSYAVICVLAYLIEIVPVHVGLWVYYDQQALWLWKGGMPLFWTFVNVACIFVPLTLIKLCYPMLKGVGQLLVVALSPIGAFMGHMGAGFPYYNAVNSSASPLLIELSGVASVLLALLIVQLCSRVLAADTARLMATAPETSAARVGNPGLQPSRRTA